MKDPKEPSILPIKDRLRALSDPKYRDFVAKLIPTLDKERILGVRTPALRALAKQVHKNGEAAAFMAALPHETFEENSLHACLLGMVKEADAAFELTEAFLPYVDNWATCDALSAKAFLQQPEETLRHVNAWLSSPHTYTKRFAIGVLMANYLGEHFEPEQLELVAQIESPEYYVNMMRAWYFSMALVRQWDATLPLIECHRLDRFTHLKTIQKAVDSYQISDERKEYLKSLRKAAAD